MANIWKTLGLIGAGVLAGGVAGYAVDKMNKAGYGQAYQTNDHFENEEVYEEPLDEKVDATEEESVTEF